MPTYFRKQKDLMTHLEIKMRFPMLMATMMLKDFDWHFQEMEHIQQATTWPTSQHH